MDGLPARPDGCDAARCLGVLDELIEAGMEIVRTLVAQARAEPEPHPYWGDRAPVEHPTEHVARCFDRVSRSIRRSIVLARRIGQGAAMRGARGGGGPARPGARFEGADADERDAVQTDRCERIDAPDDDEDFAADIGRPAAEVIDEIRDELGLEAGLAEPEAAAAHWSAPDAGPAIEPTPPRALRRSG